MSANSDMLPYDPLLPEIADYAADYTVESDAALPAARSVPRRYQPSKPGGRLTESSLVMPK